MIYALLLLKWSTAKKIFFPLMMVGADHFIAKKYVYLDLCFYFTASALSKTDTSFIFQPTNLFE